MLHKTLSLLLLTTVFATTLSAQSYKHGVLSGLDKAPEFVGGEPAMYAYISRNLKYPGDAVDNNVSGIAVIGYYIGEDGAISDVKILREPGHGCGQEAKRVISSMPKWSPGLLNEKPVRSYYEMPVRFTLDEGPWIIDSIATEQSAEKVWEIVRSNAAKTFKANKADRTYTLVAGKLKYDLFILEMLQRFSINSAGVNQLNFKNLGELNDYIVKAQKSPTLYSRTDFQGQGERYTDSRSNCIITSNCIMEIFSLEIPKGYVLTFFTETDFKGDSLKIDAKIADYRCADLSKIAIKGPVSTSNKDIDWSGITVQSFKIEKSE